MNRPLTALLLSALTTVACAAQLAAPNDPHAADIAGRGRFTVALWGDMPYGEAEAPKIAPLIADINAAKVAFTIFDGDIKSGSTLCTDDVYTRAGLTFDQLVRPMVYVPGDNEWTDCHRINNGGYNNLERLAHIRQTMFNTPYSFGQKKIRPIHQGAPGAAYAENVRWMHKGVMFVGLNVPGSNNNLVKPGECLSSKSVRTQADCDADTAEYQARDAANLSFLATAFDEARAQQAAGVMVVIQADPGFDLPETEDVNEQNLPGHEGYAQFLTTLAAQTQNFNGEVVLVHGDTHFFKLDKPLFNQPNLLKNFTRLETFGSPNVHWVEVTVDAGSRDVFTFRPRIVPGN
jgi:hypothetical protein